VANVGMYEAKTRFASLIERVQKGEEITITKHGAPVAKISPIESSSQLSAKEIIAAMRETRKQCRLDGLSIREMIEEGRRY
jgi:prevent-host-death family protein